MAVSLTNRKNTHIEAANGVTKLLHHGSNTCTIDRNSNEVSINLCGWDSLTTRGKIHAFLIAEGVNLSVGRDKGTTYATRRTDKARFELPDSGKVRFKLDTLDLI